MIIRMFTVTAKRCYLRLFSALLRTFDALVNVFLLHHKLCRRLRRRHASSLCMGAGVPVLRQSGSVFRTVWSSRVSVDHHGRSAGHC